MRKPNLVRRVTLPVESTLTATTTISLFNLYLNTDQLGWLADSQALITASQAV